MRHVTRLAKLTGQTIEQVIKQVANDYAEAQ
jgi:hypothetical protein